MNFVKFKRAERINAVFCLIVGTLSHFLYDWSGQNKLIALFSPVNESTFEHLKLLFFPWLWFGIVEVFLLCKAPITNKCRQYVIPAKTIGVISGCAAICISFYTYTGFLGYSIDFINILTFVIGVAVQYFVTINVFKSGKFATENFLRISIIIIIVIIALFTIFTFFPPHIAFFRDPLNFSYGI